MGTFGELLRGHRLAAKLTQEELAERAGVSAQAVGALERGDRRFPHRHTVDRLAETLALSGDARQQLANAGRRRGGPKASAATPRQLPADIAHFTGQAEHVDTLVDMLSRPTATVVAIVGMAGVGKTSLAVHVGHRLAERFPDGQVYLDLRGTREPLPATRGLGLALRALGIATGDTPADEAAAVLRSFLAHQRVLLVLDDAASAEQAAMLLPGSGASAAVITSRHELGGLPQAHHLRLDVLGAEDAVALLATSAGPARVAAEPGAAAAIARRCGWLPLAVELVGARLAARQAWPLSHVADRLLAEHRRLDVLGHDGGVRASFAVSVDHLDKAAAAAFTLFGLIETPLVTVPVVARLLDVDEPAGERVLEQLADRHLVRAMSPGRYRMHELLHEYARELAGETLSGADRDAALVRVLELVTAVVWHGHSLAAPRTVRGSWAGPDRVADGPVFACAADAFAWLDDHRHLFRLGAAPGMPPALVTRLGIGSFTYFLSRGNAPDWAELAAATLAAARATADRLAVAIATMDLGLATCGLSQDRDGGVAAGLPHLTRALAEFRALDHAHGLAMCLMNTGDILEAAGDVAAALTHNEEALAVCVRTADFPGGEAVASANLGGLYLAAGDLTKAQACYHRSLTLNEEIGYTIGVVDVLRRIGEVHHRDGRHDTAEQVLTRCVALCREHGYPVIEAAARHTLGFVLRERAGLDAAREQWRAALAGYEKYGKLAEAAAVRRDLGCS